MRVRGEVGIADERPYLSTSRLCSRTSATASELLQIVTQVRFTIVDQNPAIGRLQLMLMRMPGL